MCGGGRGGGGRYKGSKVGHTGRGFVYRRFKPSAHYRVFLKKTYFNRQGSSIDVSAYRKKRPRTFKFCELNLTTWYRKDFKSLKTLIYQSL